MRKKILGFAFVLFLSLVTSAAVAAPEAELRTARAELNEVDRSAPIAAKPGDRGVDDLRDSAALVLVGSMLIGLAAAVRRTA